MADFSTVVYLELDKNRSIHLTSGCLMNCSILRHHCGNLQQFLLNCATVFLKTAPNAFVLVLRNLRLCFLPGLW